MTTVAVTGASGWVGRATVASLMERGAVVRSLVRTPRARGEMAWPFADSSVPAASLTRALEGCESLIHCAAHVHVPNETATERARFVQVNVLGTQRVIDACVRAGVRKLVLVSTLAVYDWSSSGIMSEDDDLDPATEYGRSKAAAEFLTRSSSLDWRIARLSTVFGLGDVANFDRLAAAMRRRAFVVPGDGRARKSTIAIDRAGDLLARLALLERPAHRTVNLANPYAPSLRQICDGFAAVCGFPRAPSVPVSMLTIGARIGDAVNLVRPLSPLTTRSLTALTTDTVVDCTRQHEVFGPLEWKPFAEELRGHADYYRGKEMAA